MAGITVIGTGNMIRWFACGGLPIVAAVAVAGHFRMIHVGDR